jgi:DNA-binding NtrC family response regulator
VAAVHRSYAELILGLVARRRGDLSGCQGHFHAALTFARQAKSPALIAWSSLHEFRTIAETQPSDALPPMLRRLRHDVAVAGDATISTYMHDSIALMEASLGRPEEARRHLRICRSLLEQHPNAWLEQLVSINGSFIDFFESKYEDGLKCLRKAKALLPLTGDRLKAIIEVNEAHALLGLGRLSAATERFASLVQNETGFAALAALDGLARASLARDDLQSCTAALNELAAQAASAPGVNASFATRWTSVTRAKLLLRQRRYSEALLGIDGDLARSAVCEDRLLVAMLGCLKAEALAGEGKPDESASLLATAMGAGPITADHHATFYRAAGFALHVQGHALASSAFSLADAVWQAVGNKCASAELVHRVALTAPACSRLTETERCQWALATLSSLFGFTGNHEFFSEQLTKAIGLLIPASSPVAEAKDSRVGNSEVDIGELDGRRVTVSCSIPDDPFRALLLADVFRVARAALALERYKREERSRAALWPADPVESEAGVLFLSDEMQTLLANARRVAAANIPVLITGETGTGKEVLARLIHAYSPRAKAPFIPFNCTATPKEMLDSQLFGHRRGAFTGATENFQGVIRAASGGTLFLDEIGETTLDVQPKLLRFLESSEVHPIGEARPARVDVRVIAATNADLHTMVAQGRFRQDLLYRLNTVTLPVPPLRERRVEIPALATHYLNKYAAENHKGALRLAEDTIEYLVLYRWPGNIRQLANEMRRMAALAEKGAVLMPEHLSPELAASRRTVPPSQRILEDNEVVVRTDQPMAAGVAHYERTMILRALKLCGGRLEETAAMLGLSRKGLYLKRLRYGLDGAADGNPTEVT